jgi:hypothetical protein
VNAQAQAGNRLLEPLRSRAPWVVWGLIVQALGAGSVAVVIWRNIRNQGIGGHVTAEMVKLAWRSDLHTRSGLIVLVAGAFVYAAGSVLMARPYMSSPVALFVAVPVAAVAGLLLLGVLALIVAALFAWLTGNSDVSFGVSGSREKNDRR